MILATLTDPEVTVEVLPVPGPARWQRTRRFVSIFFKKCCFQFSVDSQLNESKLYPSKCCFNENLTVFSWSGEIMVLNVKMSVCLGATCSFSGFSFTRLDPESDSTLVIGLRKSRAQVSVWKTVIPPPTYPRIKINPDLSFKYI